MKKVLVITEEVNRNSEKNGFFYSILLDLQNSLDKLFVLCLRKGEVNFKENVRIDVLDSTSKLSKIFDLIKYFYNNKNNFEIVLVHRNPEYVIILFFMSKLFCKRIYFYYSHKHLDWKVRVATILSDKVFSNSLNMHPLKPKKLEIVESISEIF